MRKRPEGALWRFNRKQREREAKEALYNHEPRLPGGFESEAKKDGSLWGTVSFWSPKAKRMTKFEPADKSRGSQGAGPVESKTGLPRGTCEVSPETVAEMLRTSNQLLQAVLQLLQKGPKFQRSQSEEKQVKKAERVKERVDTACVACQTDPEKRSVACQAEIVCAEEESWGRPQSYPLFEDVMAGLCSSSGCGTDLSSVLDEEENRDDSSSESGNESLTYSPCEGRTKGGEFDQQKPRGFKRGPGRTGHSTSVAGIRDQGAKDQGWHLGGSGIFTNVPKGWAEGEEQEESQNFSSSSSNFPGGWRDFKNPRREEHRRVRTARDSTTKSEATRKDTDFGSTWQNGSRDL